MARAAGWLEQFARRAWRRPLDDGDRRLLLQLYRETAAQGLSFDSTVKVPLLAVLVSPNFLYRGNESLDHATSGARETDAAGEARPVGRAGQSRDVAPLSSYELARRLSFFLWASLPDDELLRLAAEDKLRDPTVLKAQARRMLRDPRAKSLATDFAGQLWSFSDFENFDGPDRDRFAQFTPELRQAMYEEVVLYLDDLFRNDRPLTNLIDADYTFVNEVMARHYALNNVEGTAFRRVRVDEQRGGLAGMGLFLTQSSLPLRTSPVQRGVWLLEKVLGDELPNPPAGVPPLSEDDKNEQGENIREQLRRHREKKSCASCHNKIDPLGVALENYDPIGRWRETERDGSPLATMSVSHDGVTLHGTEGLKRFLLKRQDDVFRHFNRKLLGYALGRAVGPGDRRLLEGMRRQLAANQYRFGSLIDTIVTSNQFRMKRTWQP